MKPLALVLCLFLAGCVSAPTGQGSRLLPWNWFHADANAAATAAAEKKRAADAAAIEAAHVETIKAAEALTYAQPSPPVDFARRTLAGGNGLLAQVAALSAERQAVARQIVTDLFAGPTEKAQAAERQQTKAEAANAKVSRAVEKADAGVSSATADLFDTNLSNAGDAAKYRRLWFWIIAIVGGWLLLQLLAGLSRFHPALAPFSRVAGYLSAPAVQAGYERLTKGVSTMLADADKTDPATAEALRSHLDAPLDETDKRVIRAKVNASET